MNNTTVQHEELCSRKTSTLFTVLLSIISLGALIGNTLEIVTFFKTRRLRTSTNYYLVNMAMSDLICARFNWPLYATEGILTGSEFIAKSLASVTCKLGMYFRGISQVVSVLSVVLISVDRYIAIALPLKTTKLCRGKVRLILLFSSWIIPIVCGLPHLFYTRAVKLNGTVFCRTVWSKSLSTIYIGVGFVIFYCGPVITIIVFYSLTIRILRKRPTSLEKNEQIKIHNRRKKQNEKIRKLFMIIVASFFICWTPLVVYLALKIFHPELFLKDICLIFAGVLFYILPSLSTTINPVILLLLSSNYREALNDLILCEVFKGLQTYLSTRRTSS